MASNGGGPPPGSPHASPWAQQIPASQLAAAYGSPSIDGNDPGFQPPKSELGEGTKSLVKLIYRDLPLVTIQNSWDVQQVVQALAAHNAGIFEGSGQLADSILGDDRVHATLGSRNAGLFGCEVKHRAANDSDAAIECLRAWEEAWPYFASPSSLSTINIYAIIMGFSPGQLVWDTSGPVWRPRAVPWHPRYTYYHWSLRRYMALSLDGQITINPGDAKWLNHAPHGDYRGWIRGAVRAIAEPWLIRHFAIRDWARFSEVHGMPIRKAKVPAAADETQRDRFQNALIQLGRETTIMVPTGVDGMGQDYDLELIEARDTAWESFPGLRDHCDLAIVLALKFQNLTTEIKSGGSYAAAVQHGQGEIAQTTADNEAWKNTLYHQVIRPFAYLNFGDADLAPTTDWDVQAMDKLANTAKQFQAFGTSIEVLRRGGVEFEDASSLRSFAQENFGITGLPQLKLVEPVAGGGGK